GAKLGTLVGAYVVVDRPQSQEMAELLNLSVGRPGHLVDLRTGAELPVSGGKLAKLPFEPPTNSDAAHRELAAQERISPERQHDFLRVAIPNQRTHATHPGNGPL